MSDFKEFDAQFGADDQREDDPFGPNGGEKDIAA